MKQFEVGKETTMHKEYMVFMLGRQSGKWVPVAYYQHGRPVRTLADANDRLDAIRRHLSEYAEYDGAEFSIRERMVTDWKDLSTQDK